MTKPVVLLLASYYLPSKKAGGPVRSIENMVNHLSDNLKFHIITSDRDIGDTFVYPGIDTGEWVDVKRACVKYIDRSKSSRKTLLRAIQDLDPDIIYLNSLFDPCFTVKVLLLRWMRCIDPKIPILLAPRGELASGALNVKSLKKKIYLAIARLTGMYSDILWQATSEHEKNDIQNMFNPSRIWLTPNLPAAPTEKSHKIVVDKCPGELRIVCVSRVARNKNIHGALKILLGISGKVIFDIYGPSVDRSYRAECEKIISDMPDNVQVRYQGRIEHDMVSGVLMKSHVFLLPTCGENFGHAILEAMMAGKPVIISDLTPWRHLSEHGVGYDLPLDNVVGFRNAIHTYVSMDADEYAESSNQVRSYVEKYLLEDQSIGASLTMFDEAIECKR